MVTENCDNNSPTQFAVQVGGASGVISSLGSLGTSGQVLTSAGAGANPTWTSGASLVYLSTTTVTNAADLHITSNISATYNHYLVLLRNILPLTTSVQWQMQVSTNAGSTWVNSGYVADLNATGSTSTTFFVMSPSAGMSTTSSDPSCALVYCLNFTSGSNDPQVVGQSCTWNGTNTSSNIFGGFISSATTVNAIRFLMSSGNITGTADLYGIRTS